MPLGADNVSVKAATFVPLLPSLSVTSAIAIVGSASSSVIVAEPCASAIVALAGRRQVDDEGLIDLVEDVAVHGDRHGLRGAPGAKLTVPEPAT